MKNKNSFLITHPNNEKELKKVFIECGITIETVTTPSERITYFFTEEDQFDQAITVAKQYMVENYLDGSWLPFDHSMEYEIYQAPIAVGYINPAYKDFSYITEEYEILSKKLKEIESLADGDEIMVYINIEENEATYITNLSYEEGLEEFKKRLIKTKSPFDTIKEVGQTGKVLSKTYISNKN